MTLSNKCIGAISTVWCNPAYSISQEICTRFCCALLCCGYAIIHNSHEVFIHIHQGCFAGTGAIVRLPQCQWSKPDGYGKISQCITTTKHSKTKTVCIFLGIYCMVNNDRHGLVCKRFHGTLPSKCASQLINFTAMHRKVLRNDTSQRYL